MKLNELGEKGNPKSSPKLWECGKLALFASFPRRCGKRGKGLFLFLSFHTAVISIALLSAGSDRLQDELVTIESRQGKRGEMDSPVAIVDRFHADALSAQTLADKDLCAFPEESSVPINSLGLDVAVVFRFSNSIRIKARRTLVASGRGLLLQRLVRAFLIELLAESIKRFLLRSPVGRRRFSRLGLQRPMHALVTPILLRMTWLDPLRLNAQLHPVDG